ncbi:MAG: hypothetical protein ACRDWY_05935 [Actinomycetes bacterium]
MSTVKTAVEPICRVLTVAAGPGTGWATSRIATLEWVDESTTAAC